MTVVATIPTTAPVGSAWGPVDRLGIGGAGLVATRIVLWVAVQMLVAATIVAVGVTVADGAINAAAAWWMVYAALVDIGTLAVMLALLRRHGIGYRQLLGPATRPWQVAVGALGVLLATSPAIFFSAEVTAAMFGPDAIPPMLAIVDVPPPAAAFSVVWPLFAELVEPVAYLGLILPALERFTGRAWLAAGITVAIWAGEHAFFPILIADGGVDLVFAAYRVISVVPFLAIWAGMYYAFGRRLLPIMAARWIFNGGTALALAFGLM